MTKKYVRGFTQLDNVLKELPPTIEKRVLQNATMAAARVGRKMVSASAPRNTGKRSKPSKEYGQLYKNIKVSQLRKYKKTRGKRGARISTGNAFWGYFYEFGTKRQPARPWFRPAVEAAQDAMLVKLKESMAEGLRKQAVKLYKKNRAR